MNKLKYYLFYIIISLIISYSNRQMKTNNNDIDINMYLHFLSSTSLLEVPSCTCSCDVIIGTLTSITIVCSACVIAWHCAGSPLRDCCMVLLIASKHLTHSNTGTIPVTEWSCTHSFPHNDPMHVLQTSAILFPAMLPIFQGQLAVFEIFVTMQGFENWASKAVQAWWSWCVSWGRRA